MLLNFFKGIKYSAFADEFFDLLMPVRCGGCSRPLLRSERALCTHCLVRLPRTGSHKWPCELLEQKVFGRYPFQPAWSYLVFSRYGLTREILHHIKYDGHQRLARQLGRMYGRELISDGVGLSADMLIPVPVHWRRHWRRGYNQAACFASGIEDVVGIPSEDSILYRKNNRKSQTTTKRIARWGRMEGQFGVQTPAAVFGKQIILVDDVITTGSTLASCADVLLDAGVSGIGIITLAVVK